MNIRPLREDEVGDVSVLVGLNWGKYYVKESRPEFEAMFKNHVYRPSFVVAEKDEKIVGVAGYAQSWMDYFVYQVFFVNVEPKQQGKGIGSGLVERVIEEIKNKRGKDKKALLILLTAAHPKYYSERFGFKTLTTFDEEKSSLMALSLE